MKIIDDKEKNAHWNHLLKEGAKGCLVGLGISAFLVAGVKKRYPQLYARMNMSVKAAMWVMPTIMVGAFYTDEGSVQFDEVMYQGEYKAKLRREKEEAWARLSTPDKIFTLVNGNKYKIIFGAWAGSMWGSWHLVNKDRYMTTAQKAVQARVFAQAITVALLLGTLLLNMHEKKLEASQPLPVPEWKRFLEEQQLQQPQQPKSQ